MTIDKFIDKTRVTISNDLINYVIDGFLQSSLAFYKPNSSLMLYLETDKKNMGKVSEAQINSLVTRLMLDKLKKKYGEDNFHQVDEDTRVKDSHEEIDKINNAFKKNTFVNITKDGVIGSGSLKYDHTFIINTKPENYAEVLEKLYESIRDLNLDDVVICACSPKYAGVGYTAPIKINCSVEALEEVLNMLESMKYSFTSKTIKVLPIYDRMNTWYGYDQFDVNKKMEASAIFTLAIYQAIQKTFDSYLNQIIEIDGVLIKDYYENKSNKLQAMRDIINNSIKLEDALIANIILNTRNELSSFGLSTTNILNIPKVEESTEYYYGKNSKDPDIIAEELVSEMVGSNTSESDKNKNMGEMPTPSGNTLEEGTPIAEGDVQDESQEEVVLRRTEEARDEEIMASIDGEVARAVQDVVDQMLEAVFELPSEENISEVGDQQYDDFTKDLDKQDKIDETKDQYQKLDTELGSSESAGISTDINKANDQSYFVNANYLLQFANEFGNEEKLTDNELEALKNTDLASLNNSINRLAEAIQEADNEAKEQDIIDERLEKYAYLVDNLDNLRKKIKNSEQTVLEYFEAEEIEKNVTGDEILVFHDHSRKTAKQFVNDHLINYLVNFGSHELSYILALYADSIEQPEDVNKIK